jgi:WD repeat-containing protein 68
VEDYPNRVDILRLVEEDGGGGGGEGEGDPDARTTTTEPPSTGAAAGAGAPPPAQRLAPDPAAGFAHPYPPSRIAFFPDRSSAAPDLVATSGDFLRIWQLGAAGGADPGGGGAPTRLARLLTNAAHSAYCAPLTALDWNAADTRRLGTASIDTTCTVWDVEAGVADAQLVAHDGPVHDLAWGGVGVFASASADGSVRVFDLRDREHSTIIYEAPGPGRTALLRLAWNRADPRYLATLAAGSGAVALLDIRLPTLPVATLARHTAPATALAWALHSAAHMCTAGDDGQALIWDLGGLGGGGGGSAGSGDAGSGGGGGGGQSGDPGGGGPGSGRPLSATSPALKHSSSHGSSLARAAVAAAAAAAGPASRAGRVSRPPRRPLDDEDGSFESGSYGAGGGGGGGSFGASGSGSGGRGAGGGRKHHNPWSVEETEALVAGVEACGGGKWADIKKLGWAAIDGRSAVDLKDKWRNLTRLVSLPSALPRAVARSASEPGGEKRRLPPELLERVRALMPADPDLPYGRITASRAPGARSRARSRR